MRLPQTLILVAGLVFCTAAAIPLQQEPLAEQQFKNIQSFKGKKASDVLPAMEYMCAALKVDCEFCHTQDRASDAKEEKKSARMMIAMQNDINAKNFNGRTVITCATCHHGSEHPLSVPPVAGIELRPKRASDVKPEEVLAKFAKAVGTPAKDVQGYTLKGNAKLFHQEGPIVYTTAEGKYAMTVHGKQGDMKTGWDGSTNWFFMGGGAITVPKEVATGFTRENSIYMGPASLPALSGMFGGSAVIDNRDQVVIGGTVSGTTGRATYYFDKQTGLLTRAVFTYPTVIGTNAQVVNYSAYKKVGGVQIPTKIMSESNGDQGERIFTSVTAEKKIDSSVFNAPKS